MRNKREAKKKFTLNMSAEDDSILIWELPNFKSKKKIELRRNFSFLFTSLASLEGEVSLQQPQTKKSPLTQYNEAQQSKTGNSECIFPQWFILC